MNYNRKNKKTFSVFLAVVSMLATNNLLFIIFSVPVITGGAGISSLYAAFLPDSAGSTREKDSFQISFKRFFRSTLSVWLLFLFFTALAVFNIYACSTLFTLPPVLVVLLTSFYVIIIILLFGVLLFRITLLYYEKKLNIDNTWRTVFILCAANLLQVLLMLITSLFPFCIFLLSVEWMIRLFPLFLFFGFSVPAYLNSRILFHCICKLNLIRLD